MEVKQSCQQENSNLLIGVFSKLIDLL